MDIASIKTAYDGLKIAKDVFSAYNDLKNETDAVVKVNEAVKKVGEAQDTLFSLRDELFKLQEENRDLKKAVSEKESWEEEVSNYELVKTDGGAVVYKSKSDPEHYLCPSCFSKKAKEILQDNRTMSGKFRCIGCEGEYPIMQSQKPKPLNYQHDVF